MSARRRPDERPFIKGVTDAREREELLALLRDQWPGESEWFLGEMNDPTFRWEHARILKLGDRVVGHAGVVVPRIMRYGTARLRIGGLHAVVVHADLRGRGYGRMLIEDASAVLRDERAALAILYTATPDVYRRFGYEITLPYYSAVIAAEQAARAEFTPAGLRELRADDLPAVANLYERDNATRTGTFVRDSAYWTWQIQFLGSSMSRPSKVFYGGRRELLVLEGPRGLSGYSWVGYHDGRMWAFEVGVRPDREAGRTARTLLAALGARALVRGLNELVLICPPDHPLSREAYDLGANLVQRRGAGMVSPIDPRAIFAGILPELRRRLAASAVSEWVGRLRFEVDEDALELRVATGGELCVEPGGAGAADPAAGLVRLSSGVFARLLMGTLGASELPDQPGVEVRGCDLHLLAALFPPGYPHLWPADNHF